MKKTLSSIMFALAIIAFFAFVGAPSSNYHQENFIQVSDTSDITTDSVQCKDKSLDSKLVDLKSQQLVLDSLIKAKQVKNSN